MKNNGNKGLGNLVSSYFSLFLKRERKIMTARFADKESLDSEATPKLSCESASAFPAKPGDSESEVWPCHSGRQFDLAFARH